MGRPNKFPRERYVGRTISVTLCTGGRQRIFVTDEAFLAMVERLRRAALETTCLVPIYCFMPDHGHFMFKAGHDTANPLDCLDKFRLLSGIWFYNQGFPKWQPGTWDEFSDGSHDWRAAAKYIAQNPVRAGFVENCTDYPYLGSMHGNITDLFD